MKNIICILVSFLFSAETFSQVGAPVSCTVCEYPWEYQKMFNFEKVSVKCYGAQETNPEMRRRTATFDASRGDVKKALADEFGAMGKALFWVHSQAGMKFLLELDSSVTIFTRGKWIYTTKTGVAVEFVSYKLPPAPPVVEEKKEEKKKEKEEAEDGEEYPFDDEFSERDIVRRKIIYIYPDYYGYTPNSWGGYRSWPFALDNYNYCNSPYEYSLGTNSWRNSFSPCRWVTVRVWFRLNGRLFFKDEARQICP